MAPRDKFSIEPLYVQVRNLLAQRLASGVWPPGSVLPNEMELARELGVSSGTVRKALDSLESDRLVVRRQGRGTFVVDQASGDVAARFSNRPLQETGEAELAEEVGLSHDRILISASTASDDMTNEKCIDFCSSKGFSIAGSEYSRECYCGNSIPDSGAPVPGVPGNCKMPCAGDESEMCGGSGVITLYQKCSGDKCENAGFGVKPGNAVVAADVAHRISHRLRRHLPRS